MATINDVMCYGVGEQIFSYLEGKDLVNASLVNKQFNKIASNEPFFQELFKKMHPVIAHIIIHKNQEGFFREIKTYHPNNFWRLACSVLSSPSHLLKPQCIKKGFVECAGAKAKSKLSGTTSFLEKELKKFNGEYYQDPASHIHQAYLDNEQNRNDLITYGYELDRITRELQYCYADLNPLIQSFAQEGKHKLLKANPWLLDHIVTHSQALNEFFSQDEVPNLDECLVRFLEVAQILYNEQLSNGKSPMEAVFEVDKLMGINPVWRSKCTKLEQDLSNCQKNHKNSRKLQILSEWHQRKLFEVRKNIECISSNIKIIEEKYELFFCYMFKMAQAFETVFPQAIKYQIIKGAVAILIDDPSHPNAKDALRDIRETIDSLKQDPKTGLWKRLYDQCANGAIEDHWSENHFPEYLTELDEIINEYHEYSLTKEYKDIVFFIALCKDFGVKLEKIMSFGQKHL